MRWSFRAVPVLVASLACRATTSVPTTPPPLAAGSAPSSGQGVTAPDESVIPVPATLPRPVRRWKQPVEALERMASDGRSFFLVRLAPARLAALDALTGEVRWNADLPESTSPSDGVVLTLAGDIVVVKLGDHLGAFAAKDGGRLWLRKEACLPVGAAGEPLALRCRLDDRSLATVDLRTGRRQTAVLQPPTGHAGQIIAQASTTVVAGVETVALAPDSARVLWRESETGAEGRAYAQPVVDGQRIHLLRPREVVTRDLVSGTVLARWPLPPYVESWVRRFDVTLVASAQRVAVVVSMRAMRGMIFTGDRPGGALVALDRATIIGEGAVLAGDTLAMVSHRDKVVAAYDLGTHATPLARLAPAAAVAAAGDELFHQERFACTRLEQLEHLGAYWAEVLGQRSHPLRDCAVIRLERAPQPGAGSVLRQLVKETTDAEERRMPIRALAQDDDLETSQVLLPFAREEEPAVKLGQFFSWMERRAAAYEQLWRTGRTTTLGLCPTGAPRPLPALAATAADGTIGTAHPVQFQDIAADGSWTLICQARQDTDGRDGIQVMNGSHGDSLGDEVRPYLVAGSGAGLPIDEAVGFDPAGRYVAVREGACLQLIDVQTATAVVLPDADLRDGGPLGAHRAVAFDGRGDRMLYLRNRGAPKVVVRELGSGRESELDPGPGLIWRAQLDPEGRWVRLDMVLGGGWPRYATTLAGRTCRGAASSYSVFGGDSPVRRVTRLLPLAGGRPLDVPDLVAPFGDRLLVRRPDGALALRDLTGRESVLVPAACGGLLRHADSTRQSVVVLCAAGRFDGELAPLRLYGPGGVTELGQVDLSKGDSWRDPPRRVADAGGSLVDLDERRLVAWPRDEREVRPTMDWHTRAKGIYADRGDGTWLVGDPPSSWNWAPGPLRWRKP